MDAADSFSSSWCFMPYLEGRTITPFVGRGHRSCSDRRKLAKKSYAIIRSIQMSSPTLSSAQSR